MNGPPHPARTLTLDKLRVPLGMSRIYPAARVDRTRAVPLFRRAPDDDDEEEDDKKPAHDENEDDDEEGGDKQGDDRGDGYSE
jgi:hypothetical protein